MKKGLRKFAFLSIGILLFFSCSKFSEETHWDIDFHFNIIDTKLDPGDIFTDSFLVSNANHLKLVLDYNLSSGFVDSIIQLDDTLSYSVFNLPFNNLKLKPGDTIIKSEFTTKLDLQGVDLKLVTTEYARITLKITNQIKERLLITYQIPKVTKNGMWFYSQIWVDAATANASSSQTIELNLDGYTIDFTGNNGQDKNTLLVKMACVVDPNGNTVTVNATDSVKILSQISNFTVGYALGYFGNKTFQATDSSSLSVFDVFSSGSFDIDNVVGNIRFENFLGMDVRLKTNYLRSYNQKTGKSISLISPLIGSQINLSRAQANGSNVNSLYPTIKQIDLTNSNIEALIENMPSRLDYSMDFETNPLGNVGMGNDFAFGGKGLNANIHLEIPLTISADQLVIEDVVDYSFDAKSKIKACNLFVSGNNTYAFEFTLQIYLINSQQQIIDSIYSTQPKILNGLLSNQLNTDLSQSQLNHLRECKQMKIYCKVTNCSSPVPNEIYASDYLRLKIAVGGVYEK